MGDILSQDEIDALMKALDSGELDVEDAKKEKEKMVKDYDFRRPAKFSKEHLRTLEIIFEHYGRLLATNMSVYLRKNVQVEVMTSEALTYSEFSNALANPVVLGIVNFDPLPGNIVMEMAPNLGFTMIDRMLGGPGVPLARKREFSEIELAILERIFNTYVGLLIEPWKNVVDIHPRLERIETNSQFAQIISPSEMVALVTLNIKVGDTEDLMNICLPYITLEDIIDKINTKYWFSSMQEKNDKDYAEAIEYLIKKAEVPVKAVLGKSVISVTDFMNIQIGDVIKLNAKVEDELNVYVGNIRKFTALPGSSGESYAVRITSVIREEQ